MALIEIGKQAAVDPSKIVCVQWSRALASPLGSTMRAEVRIVYIAGGQREGITASCEDDRSAEELYQKILEAIGKEEQAQ